MAIDAADSMHYLVKYDWLDTTDALIMYPLKVYSEDPSAATVTGYSFSDSVIYATYPASENFPVKGFIAGHTKSVWAFNDCVVPELNISQGSYEKLVETNKYVGFVAKIEQEETSCNKEQISFLTNTNGAAGIGRDGSTSDPMYE